MTPAEQFVPQARQDHDLPTLARPVRRHTHTVLADSRAGARRDMVQVSSEIHHGPPVP